MKKGFATSVKQFHISNDSQLIELHVFVVPNELWVEKYRLAYNNVLVQSTSAGFISETLGGYPVYTKTVNICKKKLPKNFLMLSMSDVSNQSLQCYKDQFYRVLPNAALADIRQVIKDQLGNAVVPESYVYLRSVGRCMAMVNESQESTLLAKDFLPPQTISPDIFLLPGNHDENSQSSNRNSIALSKMSSDFGSPNDNMDFSALVFPLAMERNSNVSTLTNPSSKLSNVYKTVKSSNSCHGDEHNSSSSEEYCQNCSRNVNKANGDSVVRSADDEKSFQPHIEFIPATPTSYSQHENSSDHELTGTLTRQEKRALKIHKKKSSLKNTHRKLLEENLRRSLMHGYMSSSADESSSDKALQTDYFTNADNQFSKSVTLSRNSSEDLRKAEIEARIKARYEKEMSNLDTPAAPHEKSANDSSEKTTNVLSDAEQDISTQEDEVGYNNVNGVQSHDEPVSLQTVMSNLLSNQNGNIPILTDNIHKSAHSQPENIEAVKDNNNNFNMTGDRKSLSPKLDANSNELEATSVELIDNKKLKSGQMIKSHTECDDSILQNSFDNENNSQLSPSKKNENLLVGGESLRQGATSRPKVIEINEEELLLKIKEIEEIKKQKKETKKKKQIEKEEKQQNEMEITQKKKNRIEELKRQIEKVRQEKYNFMKAREGYVKKQRHLQAELNAKQNHVNNAWRKKYMEERKKTTGLEDEIRKLNKDIESQHRKLVNSSTRGQSGNFPVGVRANGNPSERTNQQNMVLKLQSENDDLKLRIELAAKKLAAETKMKAFVQQELKDLRAKAIKSKIDVSKYNKK